MKYKIRKLLTLLLVLALFFGPGVAGKVKNIVAPSPEVRIARAIEAGESNLDVVDVVTHLTETDKVLVVLQLDNSSYWAQSTRIWTNTLASIINIIREHGYTGLLVLSGWSEGQVSYASLCENLRVVDCVTTSITPSRQVDVPWLGKGNP